ncbi:MAG TPA: dihydrofolate reductase family protein [Patescibacteria group bacterium]|nr:dihydrofolate reductase family protein [Patescibacteria group bacterium]
MKIILIAVTSINGYLTNGADPNIYKWTSKEDQKFFFDQLNMAKLIVMGSSTYEAVRDNLGFAHDGKLRIILTSLPTRYVNESVPGALEFSSETPRELCKRLSDQDEILLLGGSKVYSSFMKAGLVDEIYLTIEPVAFGSGKPLFSDQEFEKNLELESSKKLNDRGSLLLKYKVNK